MVQNRGPFFSIRCVLGAALHSEYEGGPGVTILNVLEQKPGIATARKLKTATTTNLTAYHKKSCRFFDVI